MLASAVHYNWLLHQLDVANAFLRGILNEDIYMTQPQGFIDPCFPHHLRKYTNPYMDFNRHSGLVWTVFSHLCWSFSLYTALPSLSYSHSTLCGCSYNYRQWFQVHLHSYFSTWYGVWDERSWTSSSLLRDWGSRTPSRLFLSQSKYAKDLLERTPMLDCRPYNSPLIQSFTVEWSTSKWIITLSVKR